MKAYIVLVVVAFFTVSCAEKPKGWVFEKTIATEGVNPIGIAASSDGFWLSDGDHHRVVLVNEQGEIVKAIDSLDRPMHIDAQGDGIMVPQYGNDQVVRFVRQANKEARFVYEGTVIQPKDSLDAPAGVSFRESEIAIADFYNNRIHYTAGDGAWMTFGKEGKKAGDFYYPTDVQITQKHIWVADAYNNRLQQFDKRGNHLQTVGENQGINAATGIYVGENQVFSTDFENNRILVFGLDGTFMQALEKDISKPTDLLIKNNKLIISNYKGSNLAVYRWDTLPDKAEEDHHHDDHHDHDE